MNRLMRMLKNNDSYNQNKNPILSKLLFPIIGKNLPLFLFQANFRNFLDTISKQSPTTMEKSMGCAPMCDAWTLIYMENFTKLTFLDVVA